MFSLSHTPAASMPPPVVLLTLRPPLNTRPQPVEAPSPLVCWRLFSCLPLVSWLVVVSTVLRASALHHLLSRCHLTHPSSTPLLCSHQLVVASHLFAPPLPLDAPLPDNWLCHCHHRYAGVVAVNAQTSLPLSRLR